MKSPKKTRSRPVGCSNSLRLVEDRHHGGVAEDRLQGLAEDRLELGVG